jgi:hypothetical protein
MFGDKNALTSIAAAALKEGNDEFAWSWQLVAQECELDFQGPAAVAFPSEVTHAGEPYEMTSSGPPMLWGTR